MKSTAAPVDHPRAEPCAPAPDCMEAGNWGQSRTIVNVSTGTFTVARFRVREAESVAPSAPDFYVLGGVRFETRDADEALITAGSLNASRPLPFRCGAQQFRWMANTVVMSQAMRQAVRDVVLVGMTWKSAAARNGVSQSGMLRAMRRMAVATSRP